MQGEAHHARRTSSSPCPTQSRGDKIGRPEERIFLRPTGTGAADALAQGPPSGGLPAPPPPAATRNKVRAVTDNGRGKHGRLLQFFFTPQQHLEWREIREDPRWVPLPASNPRSASVPITGQEVGWLAQSVPVKGRRGPPLLFFFFFITTPTPTPPSSSSSLLLLSSSSFLIKKGQEVPKWAPESRRCYPGNCSQPFHFNSTSEAKSFGEISWGD